MSQHPIESVGHRFVIPRCGNHPRGRALENKKFAGLFCDLWNKLAGTCARANDRDPLACEVDTLIPLCRMKGVTSERFAPSDVGIIRAIQLSDSRYQNVRPFDLAPTHVVN